MLGNYRKNYKGFTLLELLVVVLIIGILAAIALPQYKFAIAKSKYNTLKNITKSLKESVDRYYLTTGKRPTKFSDLDVDLSIITENDGTDSFYIYFSGDEHCEIYHVASNREIICSKKISNKLMRYRLAAFPWTLKRCDTYSTNTSDITNKVCQYETNKTAEEAICNSSRCQYDY